MWAEIFQSIMHREQNQIIKMPLMNFTWLATPTSSLPKRKILGHLLWLRCLKQRSRCFLTLPGLKGPSLLFFSSSVSCFPFSPFLFRTLIAISKNSPMTFCLHLVEASALPSQNVKFSTWKKARPYNIGKLCRFIKNWSLKRQPQVSTNLENWHENRLLASRSRP